jgi:hypothetical protein
VFDIVARQVRGNRHEKAGDLLRELSVVACRRLGRTFFNAVNWTETVAGLFDEAEADRRIVNLYRACLSTNRDALVVRALDNRGAPLVRRLSGSQPLSIVFMPVEELDAAN